MAARDGRGSPLSDTNDEPRDMSDTESGSSYAGSDASTAHSPACPYRTSDFHDQECSRFFDCPTHILERNPTDAGASRTENSHPGELDSAPRPRSQPDGTDNDTGSVRGTTPDGPGSVQATTAASTVEADLSGRQDGPSREVDDASSDEELAQRIPRFTLLEALSETRMRPGEDGALPSNPAVERGEASQQSPQDQANSRPLPANPSTLRGNAPAFRPSAPTPPARPTSRPRTGHEVALPRWQPDAEVTLCPICNTQFSFFVRKHHCRKCGRVVCASCSPHRITIPYQYIVRPPGDPSLLRASGFFGDEGEISDFATLGGGERVRLCNPCVPDPNIAPPQSQNSPSATNFSPRASHHRAQSNVAGQGQSRGQANATNAHGQPLYAGSSSDLFIRNRSVTVVSTIVSFIMYLELISSQNSRNGTGNRDNHYQQNHGRIMSGTPPPYYPHPYHSGHGHPSSSRPILSQSQSNALFLQTLMGSTSSSSSSAAAALNNRPLPPPPQIPEEDECPVCHRELPSRDLPNFEAVREAHITSCITAHSTYSGPSPAPGQQGSHGTPPVRAVRRTGMFPYIATEKDCVDSAECTICLEEFEVGVPMARLECLCRFHRSCISAWFVEHPGRCPVHQHDSFGY